MKFAGDEGKRSVEKFKRSQLRLIAVLAVSSASRKCGSRNFSRHDTRRRNRWRRLCRPLKWASPHLSRTFLPRTRPRTSPDCGKQLKSPARFRAVSLLNGVDDADGRRWKFERAPNNGRLNEPLIIPSTREDPFIESTRADDKFNIALIKFHPARGEDSRIMLFLTRCV